MWHVDDAEREMKSDFVRLIEENDPGKQSLRKADYASIICQMVTIHKQLFWSFVTSRAFGYSLTVTILVIPLFTLASPRLTHAWFFFLNKLLTNVKRKNIIIGPVEKGSSGLLRKKMQSEWSNSSAKDWSWKEGGRRGLQNNHVGYYHETRLLFESCFFKSYILLQNYQRLWPNSVITNISKNLLLSPNLDFIRSRIFKKWVFEDIFFFAAQDFLPITKWQLRVWGGNCRRRSTKVDKRER